jgi:hypothetical protein
MRWPIVPVLVCLLGCACLAGPAGACRCPPQIVHHHRAAVRVWHRYVVRRAAAPCPIALAYAIRPGCNAYHEMMVSTW